MNRFVFIFLNQAEEAAAEEAGGRAGPSNRADPGAGARWDDEQAEKRKQEAAKAEDVEVEVLSQQLGDMNSPSKPPAPKKLDQEGWGGRICFTTNRVFIVVRWINSVSSSLSWSI